MPSWRISPILLYSQPRVRELIPLQGDCDGSDTCFAMSQLCPDVKPGDKYKRSPCGASFPGLQPDGYVNEEWCEGVVSMWGVSDSS